MLALVGQPPRTMDGRGSFQDTSGATRFARLGVLTGVERFLRQFAPAADQGNEASDSTGYAATYHPGVIAPTEATRIRLAADGADPIEATTEFDGTALFTELQPVTLQNCRLARIGSPNDGGYLMCENLLAGLEAAYSYGIGSNDVTFSKSIAISRDQSPTCAPMSTAWPLPDTKGSAPIYSSSSFL